MRISIRMPTNTNRTDTEMNPTAGSTQANWWQTTSRETTNVSEPAAFVEPVGATQQAAGNANGRATVDTNPPPATNNNSLHRSETLPIPEPLIIIPGNLSVTGPMLDLPPIRPPELKIIGRSVSFVADCVEKGELRDYYYQGMVAQITRDTVTMLEVLKFTVEGYAAYKAKGQNNAPANVAAATESQTQSRIVAVGTPLPRRNRSRRNPASTALVGDGNSHAVMGSSVISDAERGESVSVAPSFLSPESLAGNNSTTLVPPHVMSPPHPTDGPNSVTAAANNFSIDASIVGSARAGTQLYDYNAYNQQNHYINSSTLMPDTGPRAGNSNAVPQTNNGIVTPYTITTNHSDLRQPAQPGGTRTTLDSLLPILDPIPSAYDKAPVWLKDQPLAHFKFMTFARRKIRKVEFSTDHPMAGLVEPFYVSHFFRPHWEPNLSIINNGPDAAVVGPAQNDTNATHNHNPYGNEVTAPTNEPIANVSPQEMARRAKEKAKKKWQAQQAADNPIPLEVPLSYSKLIVGKERNTSHPFMGINLRVIDPNGYRRRKALYKQELRDFFERNEKARELASCALLPRLTEAQNNNSINITLSEDADATVVNKKPEPKRGAGQNDATIENELRNPAVDSTPYGGTTEEASRGLLTSVTSMRGAESSSSSEDDDDDDEGSGANERPKNGLLPNGNQVVANSENSGKTRPNNDTEGMDTSLASASRARGLKRFKPKSTVATLGGGDDEDKAHLWGEGISLKFVDPQTLEKLIAEGAPPRPSAYEYPTSLSELYDDPKWRNGNPYILQDLERIRMFVRRFLVHTSQGNNQRQIPLSVFVAQRCPWPNPSESVLREILYAELASLIKIESELVAKASNTRGASTNTTNHPNMIGEAGEEVSPGRLLLAETGVITRTTYLAISHIAVSIGLLLYSASAFSSLEKYFVASYASNLAAWVVAAAATHLFLGAASGFHALKMKAPVDLCHASPRLLMESVSFTLMLLSLIQLVVLMAGKRNLFKNITEEEEWMRLVRSENEDSCNFMIKNSCSGYNQLCTPNPNQCQATCLGFVLSYTETCEDSVGAAVRNSLLPILCIVAICFVFICIDIAYNLRYARVASRLARALS